jgi:demethylmenaquinone methyltransferase/2-methoxy-6-polyprenyl-1,4-benzoquinol methylase
MKDKQTISRMFNRVAGNYDLMNLIITFGGVHFWRRASLAEVTSAKRALDVATGTGAYIPELKKIADSVEGVDFSPGMLEIAKRRFPDVNFTEGDALNLPFPDKSFDLVTIGFGIRNFENLELGLREIKRVLNGTLVILESGPPQSFLGRLLAKIHAGFWVPLVARLCSSDPKAYSYLLKSTESFLTGLEIKQLLESLGFKEVKTKTLAFGNINIIKAKVC